MTSSTEIAKTVHLHGPDPPLNSAARWDWALLAPVLALAAVLRWLHIGDKSFWMDEGVSFAINHLTWIDFLRISCRRELNMAPYYLLLRAWMRFGSSEAFLRSLSMIFSVAAVAVIYLLGRQLFGMRAGLFAALLAAVHAFLIRYAQEARSYSLVILLVTLSCLFFVRGVRGGDRKGWVAYSTVTALAIYCHFFALLVVLAQWISLQFLAPAARPAGLHRAWKIVAMSVLPLMVFIASRGAGPIAWITRPTASTVHDFLLALTGNGGNVLLVLYGVLVLFGAGLAVAGREQLKTAHELWGILFALSWLAVPVAVTLIFSLARPVFLPRYLVICTPALVLLAGAALVRLPSVWLQAPMVLLLAWFSVQGVRSYYSADFDIAREDWRNATHYILTQAQADDGMVFHAALGRMPFEYYMSREILERDRPKIVFPSYGPGITYADFVANAKNAPIATIANNYSRVWLVLAHNQLPAKGPDNVTNKLETALENRFACIDREKFPEIEVLLYSHGTCAAQANDNAK